MTAALYARSETRWTPVADQLRPLKLYADRNNIEVVKVITDNGATTSEVLFCLTKDDVDCILIYNIDRLGGNLLTIVSNVRKLHNEGVEIYCLDQCLCINHPLGQPLYSQLSLMMMESFGGEGS